jgi:hypothetical protein
MRSDPPRAGRLMNKQDANAWRRREIFWTIVRLLVGLIQIAGVTTSVLLLIGSGLNRLSCGAVVTT